MKKVTKVSIRTRRRSECVDGRLDEVRRKGGREKGEGGTEGKCRGGRGQAQRVSPEKDNKASHKNLRRDKN